MPVRFWLDGEAVEVADLPPTTTLLRYLRDHLGRTGTKEGCGEGDCGACTVAVLDDDGTGATWRAVNSCLLLLPMIHGKHVLTAEGLARGPELHAAQVALVEHRGSQCGYCTPGVVMSLFAGAYRDDVTEPRQAWDQVAGNLCRCTGYRPIREAAEAVVGSLPDDRFAAMTGGVVAPAPLDYAASGQRYLQPATLPELWGAMAAHPGARLVAGGTDVGLEITKQHRELPVAIGLEALDVLRELRADGDGWWVGSGVRLAHLERVLAPQLPALDKLLRVFGSLQIRSRATVGGNLCTASPIGDLAPLLLAFDAVAVVEGPQGRRRVPMADFFPAYRQTALASDEILRAVWIPRPAADLWVTSYKVSRRRELDISAVSAGMAVRLVDGAVAEVRLAYGGVAATPLRARSTEAALTGGPWTEAAVRAAAELLPRDLTPISDHRASADYRATVAGNLLLGFFLESQRADRDALPARPTATVLP